MLIDFFIDFDDFEKEIDLLEEELLNNKEEIKEDLSIHIDGGFKIERDSGGYEYKNFEIKNYLDENSNLEAEIYIVLDKIIELHKIIKEDKYFESQLEIFL